MPIPARHLPPFQVLVDAHWRDVARLARALTGANLADDVAQQAWLQALAAYDSVRDATNLRGWLLTITHRCAMDAHRAAGRSVSSADPHALIEPWRLAAPAAEARDAGLWRRVNDLPERQRAVVVLRFVADLDHAGIAAALGTSPTMSRRLLSDALRSLREGEIRGVDNATHA